MQETMFELGLQPIRPHQGKGHSLTIPRITTYPVTFTFTEIYILKSTSFMNDFDNSLVFVSLKQIKEMIHASVNCHLPFSHAGMIQFTSVNL